MIFVWPRPNISPCSLNHGEPPKLFQSARTGSFADSVIIGIIWPISKSLTARPSFWASSSVPAMTITLEHRSRPLSGPRVEGVVTPVTQAADVGGD